MLDYIAETLLIMIMIRLKQIHIRIDKAIHDYE